MEQGKINGIANFKKYDNLRNFVDFIEGSEKLKIAYKIPFENGQKEYFKDINMQTLEKTEIKTNGIISEPVIFDCLSLWYEENTTIYSMSRNDNEIRWNFKWDSKFSDYNIRRRSFINKGHTEAPVIIEIEGPVKNPQLELYVEGELYQTVEIDIEIQEFEKILYGTKENEFYINKQNTDGTLMSLLSLDYIKFENDNVIRLPKNRSCELRIKAENEIKNAKVSIFVFYKMV